MDKRVRSGHGKVKKLSAKQKHLGRCKVKTRYLLPKPKIKDKKSKLIGRMLKISSNWEIISREQEQHLRRQRRVFSLIKSLKKRQFGIGALNRPRKLHSNPADNVNILNRQHQQEFTDEDEYEIPKPEGDPSLVMT